MIKIFLLILFIHPQICIGQVKVVYQPREFIKNTPTTYFSNLSCSLCRDTIIDATQVELFYIMNPTDDDEGVKLLSQLTNLKILWLEGNDSDDFEEYKKNDFDQFIISPSLHTIHLYGIFNTEKFNKYVNKKRKDIKIIYD